MTNDEIFNVLRTKDAWLSNWPKENFDMHTAIVITAEEIKITQTEYLEKTRRDRQ